MLIDWFTVVAQVVNFLILVWLMKRFLYQPILKALDAREKRISASLSDAAAKVADAVKEREEYKRKNTEFDRERAAVMFKAQDEAGNERNRLFEVARNDSDAFRDKLQGKLNGEYNQLRDSIRHRTRDEVFAIARKTLADLAGTTLEERMVELPARDDIELQLVGSDPPRSLVDDAAPGGEAFRGNPFAGFRKNIAH